jgi:hypothetical protein
MLFKNDNILNKLIQISDYKSNNFIKFAIVDTCYASGYTFGKAARVQ